MYNCPSTVYISFISAFFCQWSYIYQSAPQIFLSLFFTSRKEVRPFSIIAARFWNKMTFTESALPFLRPSLHARFVFITSLYSKMKIQLKTYWTSTYLSSLLNLNFRSFYEGMDEQIRCICFTFRPTKPGFESRVQRGGIRKATLKNSFFLYRIFVVWFWWASILLLWEDFKRLLISS